MQNNTRDKSVIRHYSAFGDSKKDFKSNAFELETLSMLRREINKAELRGDLSLGSIHLDVPALASDIIKEIIKNNEKAQGFKKVDATISHLTRVLNAKASKPATSKIVMDNTVSRWVNDYFDTVTEALIDSITIVDSQHTLERGSTETDKPTQKHTTTFNIMQDNNEWLVKIINTAEQPKFEISVNGVAMNSKNASTTIQWIAALLGSICITKAHIEIISFFTEDAENNSDTVTKAKAIAESIGGEYQDYLLIVENFEFTRAAFADMPDDLKNCHTDYVMAINAVLELDRDELNAVTGIFLSNRADQ